MEILESGYYYHIYNHANGSDNLFRSDDNYRFFLKKFKQHVTPIAETYAYCLLPNHFHFLVRIKEEGVIRSTFPKFQTLEKINRNKFISKQFSNFFSSYTQSFNKVNGRKGSLFYKNFKRKRITTEIYLKQCNYSVA
ncbi:MAG: REP-associated tyrosine transposase [Bacteroidales bacterium]|nr:REP-associated tyrosine transposase [Bacteroidales bacterium]